jgi:hypothetical protein
LLVFLTSQIGGENVPYVRVRFPDETWHAVKELARRELRRAPNQVVVLVQKALEELQMEEARRPALQGGEATGPNQGTGGGNGDRM